MKDQDLWDAQIALMASALRDAKRSGHSVPDLWREVAHHADTLRQMALGQLAPASVAPPRGGAG